MGRFGFGHDVTVLDFQTLPSAAIGHTRVVRHIRIRALLVGTIVVYFSVPSGSFHSSRGTHEPVVCSHHIPDAILGVH